MPLLLRLRGKCCRIMPGFTRTIQGLVLKGTRQAVKRLNMIGDGDKPAAERLRQDASVLRKYGLLSGEGAANGQAQNAQR